MKKFLQLMVLAGAMLAGAQLASAAEHTKCENCKFYVPEFAIQKGETKLVTLCLDNPDFVPTAYQIGLYFRGGLKLMEYIDEEGLYLDGTFMATDRIKSRNTPFVTLNGNWKEDEKTHEMFFAMVGANMKQTPVKENSGALYEFYVTTDETFGTTDEKPSIAVNEDFTMTATLEGHYPQCFANTVYEARPLSEVLVADKAYAIADPVKVVARTASPIDGNYFAFLSDGKDNWVKVNVPESSADMFVEGKSYDGEQFYGQVSGFNPEFAIIKTLSNEDAVTPVEAEPVPHLMTSTLSFKPNEVVSIKGFYFKEEAEENLRAYSGQSGERGQSLTINNSWAGDLGFENGKQYNISKGVVQLKAAWEKVDAPALIKPSDDLAFKNYVIYPFEKTGIATGVEDVNADKTISSVRYYNVAGVESATEFEGVNLVVTTYTDGTTSTVKVVK